MEPHALKNVKNCLNTNIYSGGQSSNLFKGLITRKSDFALGLQVYYTNNIFSLSKIDQLTAKSCSEIGRVNKSNTYCSITLLMQDQQKHLNLCPRQRHSICFVDKEWICLDIYILETFCPMLKKECFYVR